MTVFSLLLGYMCAKASHKMLAKLTLAGMLGSPMFTKELNHLSFIQLFPSSKLSSPPSKQLTIMGWLRPDAANEGTVLVSFSHF